EKAHDRRRSEAASTLAQLRYDQNGEVAEFADECERRIFAVTEQRNAVSFVHVKPIIAATFKNIEALYERQEEITGIPTGFADLDRLTSGVQPGDLVVLAARPSMGKAQPLDAPVLTPAGYVPMGEIQAGSSVIGADGKPHRVLAVFPQGDKKVFRVRLDDGATAECCDEHLWYTNARAEAAMAAGKGSVKTLAEIRRTLYVAGDPGRLNHRIPLVAPVELAPRTDQLFVSPYLLGLLLADQSLRGLSERPGDVEAGAEVEGTSVSVDGVAARIPTASRRFSATRLALEHYGLSGLRRSQTFIPDDYLRATPAERLDLLRGLLDADGEVVDDDRAVDFTTSSRQLADGLVWLVRSLGGVSREEKALPDRDGATTAVFRVRIWFPNGIVPITSRKHLERWSARPDRFQGRFIESVEPIGSKPCQCILIDSDDHLYVTSHSVRTHNTALCLNMAPHVGCRGQFETMRCAVGIFSLE